MSEPNGPHDPQTDRPVKKPYTTPALTGPFDLKAVIQNALDMDADWEERESQIRFILQLAASHVEPKPPEVTMQMLIDAGLNAFGLQLFAESVAGKTDAHTFRPFTFIYKNIRITMEPHGAVDTRHQ